MWDIIRTIWPIIIGLAIGLAIVLLAARIKAFQATIAAILIIFVLIISVVITIYLPSQESEPIVEETPSPLTTPIPPIVSPPSPTLIWQNIYGGLDDDYFFSVQQTTDGGYIAAGSSDSYEELGNIDAYLVKADSEGNEQWSKIFDGSIYDAAYSVQQTTDGGYIIAGDSYGNSGSIDAYLVKTDSKGNEQWSQTFGGLGRDYARSVQQTADGGYIIAGRSDSYGRSRYPDAYLVKTDANGNEQWSQTFGGLGSDYALSVQQTTDGGYIIAGESDSYGNSSSTDAYIVKTDPEGNERWSQTFGGSGDDYFSSVQQTADGGYIIAGSSDSYGKSGNTDVYLIKTDSEGNEQWSQTFGGSGDDAAHSVQQTADGGYIIAGESDSYGNSGSTDAYLVKTDSKGNDK